MPYLYEKEIWYDRDYVKHDFKDRTPKKKQISKYVEDQFISNNQRTGLKKSEDEKVINNNGQQYIKK